jgi:predicted nucleic acid-binding protein
VRIVIADTGPLNYLVLIGHVDLLPILFEKVVLPSAVRAELADQDAPPSVRNWIANPPVWLEVNEMTSLQFDHDSLEGLDEGEAAAIALATHSVPICCSWMIARAWRWLVAKDSA